MDQVEESRLYQLAGHYSNASQKDIQLHVKRVKEAHLREAQNNSSMQTMQDTLHNVNSTSDDFRISRQQSSALMHSNATAASKANYIKLHEPSTVFGIPKNFKSNQQSIAVLKDANYMLCSSSKYIHKPTQVTTQANIDSEAASPRMVSQNTLLDHKSSIFK